MNSVRLADKREENQTSALSTQIASAIQIDSPITVGRRYYNDLIIGNIFQGSDIPHAHRMVVSLPTSNESLIEHPEYVMLNKMTGMIQYYEVDEITSQIAAVLGISVLVLKEDSFSGGVGEDARHGVLHSSNLGQPCFVAPSIKQGLCLVVYEELKLRYNGKGSGTGYGYHALVVPVEAMTLDNFIARFCRLVAGRDLNEEEIEINDDKESFEIIPLTKGMGVAQVKLIKLLNSLSARLSGSPRRMANIIRSIIIASSPRDFESFTDNMVIASGIYVLLHHLGAILDPHKNVSSAILIESLWDSLNNKYGFEDEWEVVNIAEHVNNVLLLPSLATQPVDITNK